MDPDAVLFAGDLYDRANPTPNEEAVALDGLQRLADDAPTYVLLGNHTQTLGDDQSALASLRAVRHGNITVVEAPRYVRIGDVGLYCLPYPALGRITSPDGDGMSKEMRKGETTRKLGEIVEHFANLAHDREDETSVLFSHVTFAGAKYNDRRAVPMSDVRVPTDRLPDFDATVAGHLHKRQRIGGLHNHWYIGVPDRWSFNDEDNRAGIARLLTDPDDQNVQWQFRPYPHAREFMTITPSELRDLAEGKTLDAPAEKCFVRVRGEVDDHETVGELERLRDEIASEYGTLQLDVEVPDDDREVSEVDPDAGIRELYDAFLDDRPDAVPDDLEDDVFDQIERTLSELQ
jgi:exonuclease SbcD